MKLIEFLKTSILLRHILLIIATTILLLYLITWILSIYTKHGQFVVMPNYVGKSLSEAKKLIKNTDFDLIVKDSIYDIKKTKGSIFSQEPPAKTKVKKDRKVYVTIVAYGGKKVPMPSLIDLSLRQATQVIENHRLKLGKIIYEPSQFNNAVLEQKINNQKIDENTMIEEGSVITLVVGKNDMQTEEDENENENENN